MSSPDYSRGYAAGRRRRKAEQEADRKEREQQAFFDRALLVALPWALEATNWSTGGKPVVTAEQRVDLARRVAVKATAARTK